MTATTPRNYVMPSALSGGLKVHVGKAEYNLPVGSRVVHTTLSGQPRAIVRTPEGRVHSFHPHGELQLSKGQQAAFHEKHFSKP